MGGESTERVPVDGGPRLDRLFAMSLPENEIEILLLHNPRCSKSRAAKAWLEENRTNFTERLYLEDPLSEVELSDLATRLDRPVAEWTRKGESAFAEAGLSASSSDAELLGAMAKHPILMERPILVRGDRAAVGRPLENFEALLAD